MQTSAIWKVGLAVGAVAGVLLAGARPEARSQARQGEAAIAYLQEQKLYTSLAKAFTAARYRIEPAARLSTSYTAENPAHGLRTRFAREGVTLVYALGKAGRRPAALGNAEPEPGCSQSPAEAGVRNRKVRTPEGRKAAFRVPDTQHARHPTHVRLTAVGRGERLTATTVTRIRTEENRVDYTHRTAEGTTFTEWYVNAPTGLEHGFLLNDEVCEMQDAPGPLALELALDTDLRPEASADGQHLTLRDERAAPVLAYEKLKVWDATGRVLPTRMRLEPAGSVGSRPLTLNTQSPSRASEPEHPTTRTPDRRTTYTLQLLVNDENATYPLTIDPIWTQQQQLFAGDGVADDQFGSTVAVDGDTAVVGAYQHPVGANDEHGTAYVFTRTGTTWTQQAQLTPSGPNTTLRFYGNSVAIDGDTVVVGAFGSNLTDGFIRSQQGSAYVFTRTGGVWTQQQELLASDGAGDDWFGTSVAIDTDTVVVGAYFDDTGANTQQGSAYVFTRTGVTWTQQQKLLASDGAAGDQFGYSVAVDGDTIVVGAYLDDTGANGQQGSAYVFTRSGGVWVQQQQLLAGDGAASDQFGYSVAVESNTAVVGAYADRVGANSQQGSAYVFTRSGGVWTQQQQLVASDGAAADNFGFTLSMDGDTLIIGAPGDNVGAAGNQGSAYVFTRTGATWTQQQQLLASGALAQDQSGSSVALDGNTVILGTPNDDVGANTNQGSAYVFTLQPDPPVISNVQVTSVAQTTATVTWTTDVSASSTVEYRTLGSIPYSTATGSAGTSHTVSLSGLTAGRTYEFRVVSITDGGSAPASQTTYPASGNLQLLTAPNLSGEVLGLSLRRLAGTIYATVTYYNASGASQSSVQIVSGELSGSSTVSTSTSLPVGLGAVAAGSAASTTLEFSGAAGASGSTAVITIGFSSAGGGSTSSSYRVTLP